MQPNEPKQSFSYSYSAAEQAELKQLRARYAPNPQPAQNDLQRLRKMDAAVTQRAQCVALILGVLGALLLGFGMSLIMTDLSQLLGSHQALVMPLGIIIGVIGCVLAGIAYPVYQRVIRKERAKIAPEVLRLTDSLIQ